MRSKKIAGENFSVNPFREQNVCKKTWGRPKEKRPVKKGGCIGQKVIGGGKRRHNATHSSPAGSDGEKLREREVRKGRGVWGN